MKLNNNCKCCNTLKEYDSDNRDEVWRLDFCSIECWEEYYLKYRCGFIPKKYKSLPIIDLSNKVFKSQLELMNFT